MSALDEKYDAEDHDDQRRNYAEHGEHGDAWGGGHGERALYSRLTFF
jgi:hypothetical protein